MDYGECVSDEGLQLIIKEASMDWSATDQRYVQHGHSAGRNTPPLIIERGKGCTLWDADGREYLDAHGGAWLTQVGHGREELVEVAAAQMRKLEHFTTIWNYSNKPAIELAEALVTRAPASLARVRYGMTGSECDDEALQIVRHYHWLRGEPERTWVLTVRGCYHGRTYGGGALSLGSGTLAGIGPIPGDVEQLTPPWPYHRELYGGRDLVDFCVGELEATIERIGARRIAAMFGEPVMAVAGMVPPPDDYWRRMTEVLKAHGILFVADEVVTAFGRVGDWYGCNYYGVEPDIAVCAKGMASGYMPIGAVIMSADVADTIEGSSAGGSYGGHPTSCAVAKASIDIIERENLLENSRERGLQFLSELQPLLDLPVVGDVRGLGLLVGVELVADKETRAPLVVADDLNKRFREETGVIPGVFDNVIEITPPLVITSQEVTRTVEAVAFISERLSTDGMYRG